jgi:hypothetical protein
MGQTPWFVFAFVVAEHAGTRVSAVPPRQVPSQRPPPRALPWLWRRIWDASAGLQPPIARPGDRPAVTRAPAP